MLRVASLLSFVVQDYCGCAKRFFVLSSLVRVGCVNEDGGGARDPGIDEACGLNFAFGAVSDATAAAATRE